jgi:hypothetical protein
MELSPTVLKVDQPKIIPIQFGFIWLNGFRVKDITGSLNIQYKQIKQKLP